MLFSRSRLAVCPLFLMVATSLGAQSITDYLNFESPPIHPIETVTLNGRDLLLVCNTPDNALEVYDIGAGPAPTLTPLGAFKTGLEPISVAVKPTPFLPGMVFVYTCNWIGDSISIGVIRDDGGGDLTIEHYRTENVGDEPMQLAFLPQDPARPETLPGGAYHEHLVVAFGANGTWGWFDPDTLESNAVGEDRMVLSANETYAVQAGRTLAFAPSGRAFVLNQRGGQLGIGCQPITTTGIPGAFFSPARNPAAEYMGQYDFDLWYADDPFAVGPLAAATTASATSTPQLAEYESQGQRIGWLGTSHFNMAFASNGDLYVVGLSARNLEVPVTGTPGMGGEHLHLLQASHDTGFARSCLWRIKDFALGASAPAVERLDLNGGGAAFALTQPTDLAVYERDGATLVLITGFSSDTLGVVNAKPDLTQSVISTIDAGRTTPFGFSDLSGDMRGPRGLAIRQDPLAPMDDVLCVFNYVEHSLQTFPLNASPGVLSTPTPLMRDPVPDYIRNGRKFLYSSRLSQNNVVSCATCHVGGHTDQLDWNLSDELSAADIGISFPGALIPSVLVMEEKHPMVTQSLRGLVDFELEDLDEKYQRKIDNAPYHWRGDRGTVDQFKGTFEKLMDGPQMSDVDAEAMREFINSIHYPPNPEQPEDRRYSGVLGNPNALTDGTLAKRGLKAFHFADYATDPEAFSTCVGCHALPEGSDNRLAELLTHPAAVKCPPIPAVFDQFIETAALRGVVEKEKHLFDRKVTGELRDRDLQSGNVGLQHSGGKSANSAQGDASVVDFISGFLFEPTSLTAAMSEALALYVREFDTGPAPSIGKVATFHTIPVGGSGYAAARQSLDELLERWEGYVREVNCGLVVRMYGAEQRFSYYFDPSIGDLPTDPNYVEMVGTEGGAQLWPTIRLGNVSRDAVLLALGADYFDQAGVRQHITVECVPLGSERRAAWSYPTTQETWWQGSVDLSEPLPPTAQNPVIGPAALQPMRSNTANRPISQMTAGWVEMIGDDDMDVIPNGAGQSPHLVTALLQQYVVAGTDNFGARVGHEPPRRFRIAGISFEPGAKLRVYLPNAGQSPIEVPSQASHEYFEVPIYPSGEKAGPEPIWESAVEFPPEFVYAMMTGLAKEDLLSVTWPTQPIPGAGGSLPAVPFGPVDPVGDNMVFPEVHNPSGFTASNGWQAIRIE
ncbi:MAG: hypothetical protein AAF628_15585 [Planctomycetota bacterium]